MAAIGHTKYMCDLDAYALNGADLMLLDDLHLWVAHNAHENKHIIDADNLRLIKNVCNQRQLDLFESLEIVKFSNKQ